MTFLLLALGVLGLYFGAEWLVVGAARIALSMRVKPLVIGMTVVAFGTSAPEMVAGAVAAWSGSTDVALGNVIGSNIANIGLILGLTGLLAAIPSSRRIFRREVPLMTLASVLVFALAATGQIGRFWGVALFGALIAFTWLTLALARRERDSKAATDIGGIELDPSAEVNMLHELARVGAGLVALVIGAQLLVQSAVTLARNLGVPEFLIAASMVAIGTSLPELATSIVAALHGEADVLVGNIVGSNVFNVLGALGVAAMVSPLPVAPEIVAFDLPVMLAFTAVGSVVLYTKEQIRRWEGALLLAGYCVYLAVLFT